MHLKHKMHNACSQLPSFAVQQKAPQAEHAIAAIQQLCFRLSAVAIVMAAAAARKYAMFKSTSNTPTALSPDPLATLFASRK